MIHIILIKKSFNIFSGAAEIYLHVSAAALTSCQTVKTPRCWFCLQPKVETICLALKWQLDHTAIISNCNNTQTLRLRGFHGVKRSAVIDRWGCRWRTASQREILSAGHVPYLRRCSGRHNHRHKTPYPVRTWAIRSNNIWKVQKRFNYFIAIQVSRVLNQK